MQTNKKCVRNVSIVNTAAFLTGLSFLQFYWYSDYEQTPFHFYNDNDGWLQLDKCGHAFSSYVLSQVAYKSVRSCGMKKSSALIYGALTEIAYMTPIEILDGLNEGYGFSWGDLVANNTGAALYLVQEALWDDQYVRPKFSYSPSGYPKYHPFYLGADPVESFFTDYNAHTYWLSLNLQKSTRLQMLPAWLNLAFGYSANGMLAEFKNPAYYHGTPIPTMERYRQFLFSLDVDFSKIRTRKIWLRNLLAAMNLLKVPFPAIEYNKVEGVRFHALYF